MHMLPLCRVPYLVNSQLPPKDVPHVGMEKGGTVTIDLRLLPSNYKNNLPSRAPRYPKAFPKAPPQHGETPSRGSYEAFQLQQQELSHRQAHLRYAEELSSGTPPNGGSMKPPPTTMLLHTGADEGPLAALSSTFPLLAHAGRRLSHILTSAQEEAALQQPPEEQQKSLLSSLSGVSTAAKIALEGLLGASARGFGARGPPLLLSSLSSSASTPHAASVTTSAAAPDAEPSAAVSSRTAADVAKLVPTTRMTRRRDCSRQLRKGLVGCPEWERERPSEAHQREGEREGSLSAPRLWAPHPHSTTWKERDGRVFCACDSAAVRQLAKVDAEEALQEDLVHSVNNTSLLLLDHAQLQLPFTGPSLQATITIPRKDRYALVLLNADGLDLKLYGTVSFYGPTQHHLSLEQKYLPETVAGLMVLNLIAACTLGVVQLTKWRGQNLFVTMLFMVNFSLAALAFGLDWKQAAIVEATGRRPAALWVASRLMRKLQDVSQLLVFIFISLGFRIVRQRLSRLEIQFIAGLAVISLYLGVFEETRYIFHAAGYVRVLIAVHSNIVVLHESPPPSRSPPCTKAPHLLVDVHSLLQNQIADSSLTPAVASLYPKLAAYQRFRWIFFAFLLKPVFSVFFKVTFLGPIYEQLLSWDEWIFVIFENGTDLLVLAALCWDFCPPRSFKVLQLVVPNSGDATGEQPERELVWDD
ncbi:lung seven transmembrane [Cyclospora cayetanensis]|uniref:Lung seven transmembrane n=1 Tax=Cyclospora cayetanensis TaxID=88456 RepID=A0A1D3CTT3_9EIME|nr:lung seven transmembrane [Cyclospora cayetanensis]